MVHVDPRTKGFCQTYHQTRAIRAQRIRSADCIDTSYNICIYVENVVSLRCGIGFECICVEWRRVERQVVVEVLFKVMRVF